MAMEWVKAEARKPEQYKAVVGWLVKADQYRIVALAEGDVWFGQDCRNLDPEDYPTYWIELPEPPRE